MAFLITLSVENIIQPAVIGGFVFDHAQQKCVVGIPEYIFRNFENQNIVGVIILNVLQLEFWRFNRLLPTVSP